MAMDQENVRLWWEARLEEAVKVGNKPLVDIILKDINQFYAEKFGSRMTEADTRKYVRQLYLLFKNDHIKVGNEFAFYGWLRDREQRVGKYIPIMKKGNFGSDKAPFQTIKKWAKDWERMKVVEGGPRP